MTANNGWPGKPGVPLNPDRDRWHWMKTGHGVAPWLWRDDPQSITGEMGWETNEEVFAPGDIARVPGTTYLGPCLTPDQASALQARVANLEATLAALQRDASQEIATDEMVRRLQHLGDWQAADRIEALQARVAELEGLAYGLMLAMSASGHDFTDILREARAAVEGKKDE